MESLLGWFLTLDPKGFKPLLQISIEVVVTLFWPRIKSWLFIHLSVCDFKEHDLCCHCDIWTQTWVKKSESNAEAADLFLTEKKHAQCCFFKLKLKVLELEVWWSTFFHHFTRANVIKAVKWFSVTQILCAQAGYNCHSDEEIKICATAEDQENWDSISREA